MILSRNAPLRALSRNLSITLSKNVSMPAFEPGRSLGVIWWDLPVGGGFIF